MMSLDVHHDNAEVDVESNRLAATTIRVMIADSQPIFRMGMNKVLALRDDIRVVAQGGTTSNLPSALDQHPVDVLLLEASLVLSRIYAIPELVRRWPHTKIIVHGAEAQTADILGFYRHGVRGVIQRSIAPDLLVKCVRKVSEGEIWIDNSSICLVIEDYRSQAYRLSALRPKPHLSTKEIEVIRRIVIPMTNKEIASQMGTTEQTVKNYLRKIYHKLGVSDRLELVLYCLDHSPTKGTLGKTQLQVPMATHPPKAVRSHNI